MLDLRPIKYRLATATPGPWSVDVTYFQPKSIWARVGKLFSAGDATFGDCDLVAHAPTDLAALVVEVERLRGAIEAHRDSMDTDDGLQDEADCKLWEVLL